MPQVPSVHLPLLGLHVRLGRKRLAVLPQVPSLSRYLLRDVPTPPAAIDYAAKAMPSIRNNYLNMQLGSCVIAGKMHSIGIWSGNDAPNIPVLFTNADVIRYYGVIGGYVSGQPWTDRGCNIVDALNYLKNTGFNGHKIAGYVSVDVANKVEVQVAIDLFGSLTLGINTPNAWINHATEGAIWGPAQPNPRQGHDVCSCGYSDVGVQVCTWGLIVTITWDALANKQIVEECYAVLGMDWTGPDQIAPPGVSLSQLVTDLQILGGGQVPPLPLPPAPDPNPPPTPLPPGPVATSRTLDLSVQDFTPSGQAKLKAFGAQRLTIQA